MIMFVCVFSGMCYTTNEESSETIKTHTVHKEDDNGNYLNCIASHVR